MFKFEQPTVYAITDAAMCLWEAALESPEIMERLKAGEGAVAARDYVQTELAPLCDLSWQYATQVLGFDDLFDWEFAPEVLRQLTFTGGRITASGIPSGLHQTAMTLAHSVVEALAAQRARSR